MIEYTQLFYHKPEQGEIGDCWRTCIACILHIDPYGIPHYYKRFWKDEEIISQEVQAATNAWLMKNHGVKYVEMPLEATIEQLGVYLTHYYKDMYVIVGCNSIHGGHSVVMRNGDYIWDPSIDKSGCIGPMKDGYYWIGLLVTAQHSREILK